MRLTRPFAVRLSLALTTAAGVASALGLGGLFSCSKYETYKAAPIDCTTQDKYEMGTEENEGLIDDFSAAEMQWWSSADNLGAVAVASTSMPDMCGNSHAGVFLASHNNDWGCVFGMWGFNTDKTKGRDASPWAGISFWARAPGNTTKSFTLILDDDNTYGVAKEEEATSGTKCRSYPTDGGVPGQATNTTVIATDPGTGTPITGSSNTRASYPDECGNGYSVLVEVTSDWQLYTIPWRDFKQTASPNRVPNNSLAGPDGGADDIESMLLTFGLRNLTLRMPKEAEMELWMTRLAFYREKAK